jgi:hypothetical protein
MTMKPLAQCPCCAGRKIYPADIAGYGGDTVVSRRCPECEHRDLVLTGPLPAMLWFARCAREREELSALCDALADGLPLELEAELAAEAERSAADGAVRAPRQAPPR